VAAGEGDLTRRTPRHLGGSGPGRLLLRGERGLHTLSRRIGNVGLGRRLRPLFVAAALLLPLQGLADEAPRAVSMYVFWGAGCPHCEDQKPFLRELESRHPTLELHRLEVWRERTYHELFEALAREHGVVAGPVPTIFVGGRVWIGDSAEVRRQVEATVELCGRQPCPDPMAGLDPRVPGAPATADPEYTLPVPLVGSVDLRLQPLLLSTALIAFVDGLNPCSLWVLTVLLALVLHSGSRRRIALVGATFLVTTASVYGLFIVGVFGVLRYVAYLGWVQILVALFALVFALVNIKDYVWFRQGPSFTIPDHRKPGIFRRMHGLMEPGRSSLALVGATCVMALGIALVELPCTAGFPVIWSGLVAEHHPGAAPFAGLLAVYLLIYLLDEVIVLAVAVTTLRMRRLEEVHGRVLKLVGGMIMLALALVLLLAPELMTRVAGAAAVFLGALAASLVVVVLHRWVLPWLGIRIGQAR
jgi:hypothetical protein